MGYLLHQRCVHILMRSFYIISFPLSKGKTDWKQFFEEPCGPEKWKECQIVDNNQQHRQGSLILGHIVGSNKYGVWKEGEQGGALCGSLLQLKCFLFLKMSAVEWASQRNLVGRTDWTMLAWVPLYCVLCVSPLPCNPTGALWITSKGDAVNCILQWGGVRKC